MKKEKTALSFVSSSDAITSSKFGFVTIRGCRVSLYMTSFFTVVKMVHPCSSASPRENGKAGLWTLLT